MHSMNPGISEISGRYSPAQVTDQPDQVANCYVFNPDGLDLSWQLNGVRQDLLPGTKGIAPYRPNIRAIRISLYDDGKGALALKDLNNIILNYPDDSARPEKTYSYSFRVPGQVSARDDLIFYCMRSCAMLMDKDGFVLNMFFSHP